jgi:hypothetical protein
MWYYLMGATVALGRGLADSGAEFRRYYLPAAARLGATAMVP